MHIHYPRRLTLAQTPTPLQRLRSLSKQDGPQIWVKRDDLTGAVTTGNKIRKLEFTLAAALDCGADTIITVGGVQSNHCRTTAILCAQLGLHCHLILRGGEANAAPEGNLLLDQLAGATISHYPQREYRARETEILTHWQQHYREQGRQPYTIPVGASDGCGLWGYIAASAELCRDFEQHQINPGHVVCATGSGGTQAGLTVGLAIQQAAATVWGINICDDADYFQHKVREDIADWQQRYPQALDTPLVLEQLSINVIDGYVGAGYGHADQGVFTTIREAARSEGLVLDPVYSGKAFHGFLQEYHRGRFDGCESVVFVHTGGVFGLLAQAQGLQLPGLRSGPQS